MLTLLILLILGGILLMCLSGVAALLLDPIIAILILFGLYKIVDKVFNKKKK